MLHRTTPAIRSGLNDFDNAKLDTVNRECPQKLCKKTDFCAFDGGVCCGAAVSTGRRFCCPSGHTCLTTDPPTCVKDRFDDENRCAEEECAEGFHCPHQGVGSCCLGGTVCCPSGTQCRATKPITCEKFLNPAQQLAHEAQEREAKEVSPPSG